MAKVEIKADGGGRDVTVLVNGHEIPDLTKITLRVSAGEITTLEATIFATEVAVDAQAAMAITTQTLDHAGMIAVAAPEEGEW